MIRGLRYYARVCIIWHRRIVTCDNDHSSEFWVYLEEFGVFWGILSIFFRVYWYSTTPPGRPWSLWRLEQLTVCRRHSKGNAFSSVILRPRACVRLRLEPSNSLTIARTRPPMLTKRQWPAFKVSAKITHAKLHTLQCNKLISVNVSLPHNRSVYVLCFSFSVWVLFDYISIIFFLPSCKIS